jgi:Catalase
MRELVHGELEAPDAPIAETLAATLAYHVTKEHPPHVRPIRRDAHPNAHGCVLATMRVDADIDESLQQGVFATPGKEYKAWIRFSNALKMRHDLVRDARGMAIKLLGVEGANETRGRTSQDFLLVTHPAFFVADARQYVDFPSAIFTVRSTIVLYFRLSRFFFGVSPPRFRWRGAWAAMRSLRWTSSPLVLNYFSQVPFRFGSDRTAKFRAVPRQGPGFWKGLCFFFKVLAYQLTVIPGVKHAFTGWEHMLRDRLRRSLESHAAMFDFFVQIGRDRNDPLMPIDDATVRWREGLSAYRKIASIHIAPQRPDTDERMAFAEHLSFSPWHALTDHRPLGSINEVRRVVYDRIAILRHRENNVVLRDPAAGESPGDYLRSIGWRAEPGLDS